LNTDTYIEQLNKIVLGNGVVKIKPKGVVVMKVDRAGHSLCSSETKFLKKNTAVPKHEASRLATVEGDKSATPQQTISFSHFPTTMVESYFLLEVFCCTTEMF
jgi:hypothetical protein